MMLKRLRWQLSALYLLAALALIGLVAGGAYVVLALYFQHTADLALQNRMALEFQRLDAPLPPELTAAEQQWYANRGSTEAALAEERDEEERHANDLFDGELASVFVFRLDANKRLLTPANGPIAPDADAFAAALATGVDWRTQTVANGTRVRLLTYRLDSPQGILVLQAGRSLSDQDQALYRLLLSLLALGSVCAALLGAASWWLAGRSLAPAQQAWERQQTFVANASHELRTPLTLIRASAEFARRGLETDDERRGLLGDVLSETDHMSRLVEDLLLLSRLDAHQLPLTHSQFAIGELLDDLRPSLERLAGERGLTLTVASSVLLVCGDAARVRQVLLILIDNALRHTPTGGEVRLTVQPQGHLVRLNVSDTGGGIAPEHLPHLFERFYRADPARGSEAGGAGLGLAIARALVEAQHGQIGIVSQPGQGTTAWFTLPVA